MKLLEKGRFLNINQEFIIEGYTVLNEVSLVQKKFDKQDTDTFINELRDSIVGYYLGYELINVEKYGFDCKKRQSEDIFLEVKSASFNSKSISATFNDTTLEKANLFKSNRVYLCLACWKDASNLLFMVYGQNPKIGAFLENKVNNFLCGNSGVR